MVLSGRDLSVPSPREVYKEEEAMINPMQVRIGQEYREVGQQYRGPGYAPRGARMGLSQIPCVVCDVGRQACYASPVPNFICDAAYAVCRSHCS
jgi:hypothetical protein